MSALLNLDSEFQNHSRAAHARWKRSTFPSNPGEFVSLVGPSGCGKSTALRLIAGLIQPDTGAVAFPAGRPEIGFVFQEPTLMPWARALDNARLPLDLEGMRSPRKAERNGRRARWRVSDLPVSNTPYPRELSGGMKMRVSSPAPSRPSRSCC